MENIFHTRSSMTWSSLKPRDVHITHENSSGTGTGETVTIESDVNGKDYEILLVYDMSRIFQ